MAFVIDKEGADALHAVVGDAMRGSFVSLREAQQVAVEENAVLTRVIEIYIATKRPRSEVQFDEVLADHAAKHAFLSALFAHTESVVRIENRERQEIYFAWVNFGFIFRFEV